MTPTPPEQHVEMPPPNDDDPTSTTTTTPPKTPDETIEMHEDEETQVEAQGHININVQKQPLCETSSVIEEEDDVTTTQTTTETFMQTSPSPSSSSALLQNQQQQQQQQQSDPVESATTIPETSDHDASSEQTTTTNTMILPPADEPQGREQDDSSSSSSPEKQQQQQQPSYTCRVVCIAEESDQDYNDVVSELPTSSDEENTFASISDGDSSTAPSMSTSSSSGSRLSTGTTRNKDEERSVFTTSTNLSTMSKTQHEMLEALMSLQRQRFAREKEAILERARQRAQQQEQDLASVLEEGGLLDKSDSFGTLSLSKDEDDEDLVVEHSSDEDDNEEGIYKGGRSVAVLLTRNRKRLVIWIGTVLVAVVVLMLTVGLRLAAPQSSSTDASQLSDVQLATESPVSSSNDKRPPPNPFDNIDPLGTEAPLSNDDSNDEKEDSTVQSRTTPAPSVAAPVSSTQAPSEVPNDVVRTAEPSTAKTARESTPAPTEPTKEEEETLRCFTQQEHLYQAIDEYVAAATTTNGTTPEQTLAAQTYGYPMSSWCVSEMRNFSHAFSRMRNPRMVDFNEGLADWDMSSATDLSFLFYGASKFRGHGIGSWNTSQVTTMESMFQNANVFNDDISNWNVGEVTTMRRMFRAARFFSPASLNAWDVSQVQDMSSAFWLARNFNASIDQWNVSKVRTMASMFRSATNFNQDLFGWPVNSVVNLNRFLLGASAFGQDLCDWGERLPRERVVVTLMFGSTGCPLQSEPGSLGDQSGIEDGPFCHVCLIG